MAGQVHAYFLIGPTHNTEMVTPEPQQNCIDWSLSPPLNTMLALILYLSKSKANNAQFMLGQNYH